MELIIKGIFTIIIAFLSYTLSEESEFKLRLGLIILNGILCGALFLLCLDAVNGEKLNIPYYAEVILMYLAVFFATAKNHEYDKKKVYRTQI